MTMNGNTSSPAQVASGVTFKLEARAPMFPHGAACCCAPEKKPPRGGPRLKTDKDLLSRWTGGKVDTGSRVNQGDQLVVRVSV